MSQSCNTTRSSGKLIARIKHRSPGSLLLLRKLGGREARIGNRNKNLSLAVVHRSIPIIANLDERPIASRPVAEVEAAVRPRKTLPGCVFDHFIVLLGQRVRNRARLPFWHLSHHTPFFLLEFGPVHLLAATAPHPNPRSNIRYQQEQKKNKCSQPLKPRYSPDRAGLPRDLTTHFTRAPAGRDSSTKNQIAYWFKPPPPRPAWRASAAGPMGRGAPNGHRSAWRC